MASLTTNLGRNRTPGGEPAVVRVGAELRARALACLLGCGPGSAAVDRFVDAAAAEGTDLGLMWGIVRDGGFEQACLVVPGSGQTAMMFASGGDIALGGEAFGPDGPMDAGAGAVAARARLLAHVAAVLDRSPDAGPEALPAAARGLSVAQCLLEPIQRAMVESFLGAGFMRLATLGYLRRDVPRRRMIEAPVWPPGVRVVSLDSIPESERDGLLIAAMNQSYIDTLDCPALCGMRPVAEVLRSHRAVGEYDPRLWWLVFDEQAPAGCLLVNRCPSVRTAELVYVGIGPSLRGRGVARGLLGLALAQLSGGPERTLACAVDLANAPALRLYGAARFERFAERVAMVRRLGER